MYLCLVSIPDSRHTQQIFIRNLYPGAYIRCLILFRNTQYREINTSLQPYSVLRNIPVIDGSCSLAVQYLQDRTVNICPCMIRYLGLAGDPCQQLTHTGLPGIRDHFILHSVDIPQNIDLFLFIEPDIQLQRALHSQDPLLPIQIRLNGQCLLSGFLPQQRIPDIRQQILPASLAFQASV